MDFCVDEVMNAKKAINEMARDKLNFRLSVVLAELDDAVAPTIRELARKEGELLIKFHVTKTGNDRWQIEEGQKEQFKAEQDELLNEMVPVNWDVPTVPAPETISPANYARLKRFIRFE